MKSYSMNVWAVFAKKSIFRMFSVLLIVTSMLTQVTPARAATISVTNTSNSGSGSLRQAILDATSGSDIITFNSSLSGMTIQLSSELPLTTNVTIDGSPLAVPITLSGTFVRVFSVNGGVTATLKNLKITNTQVSGTGGGILNAGNLTVTNSTLSGNKAVTTTGNGGAIYNSGTLIVTNSTLSGNIADGTGGGGAIYNTGTLTVTNSTFVENSASAVGGGNGGGIHNSGTLTALNSTFSGSTADGWGGGIYNSGTLNYTNTILANSTLANGGDCYFAGGTLGTNTNNIVENVVTGFTCGTPASTSDPMLSALASNGGATQTMALNTGSPAINTGTNSGCPATDQRGTARPQGATCDIGAYEVVLHTLTVTLAGTGTVTSSPTGIDCGSTCAYAFNSGTLVTLTATPGSGFAFAGWSGGVCTGTGTCQVTMDAAKAATATFAPSYNMFITKTGAGSGTVTSSPAGINCGATCLYSFASGTVVTLTASPTAGSSFNGWSGEGCSGTGTCQVTMSAAKSVTADFVALPTFTLSVSKAGAGTGTATSSPVGINCGSTCSAPFASGTVVTLTASPLAGSTFAGWSGGCSGTGACTITMSAAQSVTATFNVASTTTFTLSIVKAGTGAGTVTSSPAGISCGAACSSAFATGTVITLTAVPDSGSTFTGWSGAGCSGTSTCVFTISADTPVTATFDGTSAYTLSVSKVGTGSGVVTSAPAGIDCGTTCSFSFAADTVVTLTAVPDSSWTFGGWTGAGCTGNGTCVVTMSAAQSVLATFGTPNTFSDVSISHFAYQYIERLYNAGITAGCSTNPLMYCPDASVTRAQMAIFILRGIYGSGYTPPAATGAVFSDVSVSTFAASWIEQFSAEGITAGCGSGMYCPDANVTRAQMAIFLLRGEHGSVYAPPAATGSVFTDVPLGSFAVDWIEQLYLEGVTGGCGAGTYCPNDNVTRAQMAIFLVRTFSLP